MKPVSGGIRLKSGQKYGQKHGQKHGQKYGLYEPGNIQPEQLPWRISGRFSGRARYLEWPPLSGVFVVEVRGAIASSPLERIQGVASLGVRPAVYKDGRPTLEVYLLDFNQEIYGLHIQVDFIHKLRDEAMFPNLTELTEQIKKDVENTRNYFLNRR